MIDLFLSGLFRLDVTDDHMRKEHLKQIRRQKKLKQQELAQEKKREAARAGEAEKLRKQESLASNKRNHEEPDGHIHSEIEQTEL